MPKATAPFDRFVTLLTRGESHRLWSLLITAFGDLAGGKDQVISSTALNQITAAIGLKPEATRVALHRLRKDGWIEGCRDGRRSLYALTPEGQRQTAIARPKIYDQPNSDDVCHMVILEPGGPEKIRASDTVLWVTPNIGLTTKLPKRNFGIATADTGLPDWIRARVCLPELIKETRDLQKHLEIVEHLIPDPNMLTPIQIATLRALIVHSWRRVILKAPDLPDHVFPATWKGPECRNSMSEILRRLPKPDLKELNARVPVAAA
jgi:phenylacetic acid degradation operon negative regulatory protein